MSARFPNDRLLESLTTLPVVPLRRWAGRKAADRAMHWAALRADPEDPYILARLGLHPLSLEYGAMDKKARFGLDLAAAALGRIDEAALSRLATLPRSQRTLAAKDLALHDPERATSLVQDQYLKLAACQLAMGKPEKTATLFEGNNSVSSEAMAIATHIAVCERRYGDARQSLNRIFAQDHIAAPLSESEHPFSIDDLRGASSTVREGPKVSVIIPYHNASKTLAKAVESISNQNWKNLEILLVDDRSEDEGPALAKRLAEKDSRIVSIGNARADGVYGARNTAIETATGEFVTFLDADDWSPSERIARQFDALGKHTLGIANHIRMDEMGRPVAPRVFPIVRPVPITMFLRLETVLAAGPFEEVATGADSEMFARLEMRHGKVAVARDPAVLLVARWQGGSLSRDSEGGMFGLERYAYRADWMFRHAGLEPPCLPARSTSA